MCSRLRRERRRQVYTVYFNLLITACLLARTTEFRASVNIFYHHEKSTRKGADFVSIMDKKDFLSKKWHSHIAGFYSIIFKVSVSLRELNI